MQNLCCNTFSLTNYHGIIAWWLQPFTYICRQVQRTKIHLSILCIEKLVGYCVFFRGGGYSRVLNHDESRWRRKKFSCLSLHSKILFIIFFWQGDAADAFVLISDTLIKRYILHLTGWMKRPRDKSVNSLTIYYIIKWIVCKIMYIICIWCYFLNLPTEFFLITTSLIFFIGKGLFVLSIRHKTMSDVILVLLILGLARV